MSLHEILPIVRTKLPLDPCSEISLSAAEREMAAFVAAAQELYGPEAGRLAAECWIEQLNNLSWSNRDRTASREVTIAAASQLAKRTVQDPSDPSRRIAGGPDVGERKGSRSASRASNCLPFENAAHPVVLRRMPVPINRSPGIRASGLQLVGKHLDEPACTDRLTDGISHDMRNHLCAVYANVELMSQATASQPEREELLRDVHAAIRSTIDILDSFLFISQTGPARNFRLHSLNHVVAHAVKLVRIHPDAKKVELSIADDSTLEVCIDRTEICRAVYNLLLNACQAASRGSAPGKVHIELREERSSIQIRVTDNGPGVPETIREIFSKPFSGAENTQHMGLGLSIAQAAAREHGGSVELEKSTTGNTVFVLHLSKALLLPRSALS